MQTLLSQRFTAYVGIDWADTKHDVCLQVAGETRRHFSIIDHTPPRQAERRCSSGDGRAAPFDAVELIACRSKRSRPEGNAPG